MSTGSEVAKQSARASTVLLAGNIVSNALLVLNLLLVARLLGSDTYGIYTLALLPATAFIVFSGVGVNTAITRFSAFHISRGEKYLAIRKTKSGIIFLITIGFVLTIICYFSAPIVTNLILKRPSSLIPLIQLGSITVVAQSTFQAGIASLVGWTSSKYAAMSYVLQSVVKVVVSPTLILLGFGVTGAILGQVLGLVFASLFAILAIYFLKLQTSNTKESSFSISAMIADVKEQIRFGFPSEVGSYVSNFAGQNYVLIVLAFYVTSNAIIGNFKAATNLASLITIIPASLSLSLFAGFAALYGREGNMAKGFVHSVKYSAYGVTPFIFFLMAAAVPITRVFYGRGFLGAAPLLALISFSNIPIIIGQPLFPSFFSAVGKTKFTLYAYLADAAAAVVLSPIFAMYFQAIGITFVLLISNLVSGLTALYLSKKYLNTKIDYRTSLLVFLASLVCASVAYAPSYFLGSPNSLILNLFLLLVQLVAFFGLYLALAPLLGAISKEDITRLRSSTSDMRYIGHLFSAVLNIEDRMARPKSIKAR